MEAMHATGDALGGSVGLGIFVFTLILRSALIPVILPMAVRTRDRQRIAQRIRPEIKAIHKKYRDDPGGMNRELKRVHQEAGIKVVDWSGLAVGLIQLPILIALFQAVLELSDGTPLADGGLLAGVVASALAVAGAKISGQSEGATWLIWMSAILPVGIALWLGAGIGLYLAAFYGGALVQSFLMRPRPGATATPGPDPAPRSEEP